MEEIRLTLDEAIKHAKEVTKTNRAEATYNFPDLKEYYDNCSECANQYNQLAEWLEVRGCRRTGPTCEIAVQGWRYGL